MKTLKKIFTILLVTFVFVSCESWLDVSPSAQIKETNQFSNEQGFKDALYGVYTTATNTSLYGADLTYRLLSIMSCSYSNHTASTSAGPYMYAQQYDYTNATVKDYFNNIWNSGYSTIAHINLILKNIETKKNVMSQDVYNVIKGEMIGLRAYIHFDLFRMFAPAYTQTTDLTTLSIPYRDTYGIKPAKVLTMKEFETKLISEMSLAKGYLDGYKEIDQLSTAVSVGVGADDFMMYRQNRFNYYALKGLEARAMLWFGRSAEAATAANEVINSGKFYFYGSDAATSAGITVTDNRVFTSELVFALYDSRLKDRTDLCFTELIALATSNTSTNYFQTSTTYVNSFYEISGGGSSDLRYVNQFGTSGTGNYCKKYWQLTSMPMAIRNELPLIRLGEMYLIAAEGGSDPAIVNRMKSARAISESATSTNIQEEIRKEYLKDLYAEGQIWFYYKRMNIARFPNSTRDTNFTFPVPDDEMIYGEY